MTAGAASRSRTARIEVRAAVLVAGGGARRAGVDKRLLTLDGRTMLSRGLTFLQEHFERVVLSIGVGQELDLGNAQVELLPDAFPGSSPLVALATALAHLGEPVFALAADIAFPSASALAAVRAAYSNVDVAIPVLGEKREPLFAIYGPACLAPMRRLLEHDQHRIVAFFPEVRVVGVPFADERPFFNVNTMNDFAEAQLRQRAVVGAATDTRPGSRRARAATTGMMGSQPALVTVGSGTGSEASILLRSLVTRLEVYGLRVAAVEGPLDLHAARPLNDVDVVLAVGCDPAPLHVELVDYCVATKAGQTYPSVSIEVTSSAFRGARRFIDAAALVACIVANLDDLRRY